MRLLTIALLLSATGNEDLSRLEQRMVELINIEREARAIPKLEVSEPLTEIGRAYSRRMAEAGEVHHRLARPMEERIRRTLPDTCLFGENVSKHTSVDYSIGDLMLSSGHRKNLLQPDFTLIGVGIVRGSDGYLYITQDFARSCRH